MMGLCGGNCGASFDPEGESLGSRAPRQPSQEKRNHGQSLSPARAQGASHVLRLSRLAIAVWVRMRPHMLVQQFFRARQRPGKRVRSMRNTITRYRSA